MPTPEYSLSWIMPYVREALRQRGEFTFDGFVDGLWRVLESAGVPGIVRQPPERGYTGTTYDFAQASNQLRFVATEAFHYLIYNGFAHPGAPTHISGFRDQGRFYMTPRGTAWATTIEPIPEDFNGYMKEIGRAH